MRNTLLTLIHVAFMLGVTMGQWFFKRSWYKIYLILILTRDISLRIAMPKSRATSLR